MKSRTLAVVFFLLLAAIVAAPDLRRAFGHPLGITGLSFNYHAVVTGVAPRAAASGIRAGDRLDLARAKPAQRYGYLSLGTPEAGMQVHYPMLRGERRFVATVITFPESSDRIRMLWLRVATQIVITALATLVLLRKPSPATWGFFLLVYIGCSPSNDVYLLGPPWWRTIGMNLYWLVANNPVGSYGAIIFALYLLHPGPLPRWRRITQGITIAIASLAFVVAVWHANALMFASRPDDTPAIAYSVLLTLPLFVAPLVLIGTYFESPANVRERLRWIIGGFLISTVLNAIDQAGSQGNLGLIQSTYVTHSLLVAGMYAFMAFPVAYAVLKHHIIDVNVAISRATVYTVLSAFIVGAFALVDFFFARTFEQQSAGLLADVALALVLGFSFNSLHKRVDDFVDRFLFRSRHRAEEHVAGITAAMAYAHDQEQVCSMLVNEPVRAFDLTGARIISQLRDQDQQIQTLCAYVEARRAAVRLTDGEWNFDAAVAVPVFSHGALDALVLYGLHQSGTDLDAEEISLLEDLCTAAGAAFDRLEAQELRKEIALLRGATV